MRRIFERGGLALITAAVMGAGGAAAQTSAPAGQAPPSVTERQAAPFAPGSSGVSSGVVPPHRDLDPAIVTPPQPIAPSMPVIRPQVPSR